jgi:hypothetical protein
MPPLLPFPFLPVPLTFIAFCCPVLSAIARRRSSSPSTPPERWGGTRTTMGLVRCSDVEPPRPTSGGGAHCRKIPMASSTAHPPAANSSRDRRRCRCRRRRPRRLSTSTLTSTSHPPAATASRDGRQRRRPCLPPCRRSTSTLHPTAATGKRPFGYFLGQL